MVVFQQRKESFMYEITSTKPLPGKHYRSQYPFHQMKVGDSFLDRTKKHPATLIVAARHYVKQDGNNKKFCSRTEGKGRRIWRYA